MRYQHHGFNQIPVTEQRCWDVQAELQQVKDDHQQQEVPEHRPLVSALTGFTHITALKWH